MTVLIKFEGPQASGKTILSSYLRNNLREAGFRLDDGYAGDEFGVRDPVDHIANIKGLEANSSERRWAAFDRPEAIALPDFPELRSVWQHKNKNGNHYIVEEISNRETERQEEYPTTVIYRNCKNGKLYSRRLVDWYRSMTLVENAQPTDEQIDAEVAAKLTEEAIRANKDKQTGLAYVQESAKLIARGAALRAFREGLEGQTGDSPITGWSPLSSDEMETIAALRNGTAKVIPVSEHQLAMKMILKSATIVESPLVETFAPVDPLVAYLERQWDWSLRTFGPGFRTMGVTDHIIKEVGEVQKNPYDLMEWIDIIILALDGYWRHGGSAIRLMQMLQFKQDKNFARQWPDWRQRSEDQAIEHDRTDETQAA